MAPRPPPNPRGVNPTSESESEIQVQEIVDRAFKLSGDFNFQPPKKPIVNVIHRAIVADKPIIQNRQNNPPATVTVIANSPTTTIVTAPPATSSPADNSDVSVDSSSSLNGGAIAGIVIGSIVGLLLLIWIFRSCSNLGAPPTDTPPRDGRAWYDGVRSDYPPPDSPRSPYRTTHPHRHRHSHGGSRSRSRHSHHSHHHHGGHHYRRSGSIGVQEVQEVRGVPVAVVRGPSRQRRSTSVVRESRSPHRMYHEDHDGYEHGYGRGRSVSRSRSRGRRYD